MERKERRMKTKKPILYINKKEFCGWYFDGDVCEDVVNDLIEKENISLNDYLDVGYIPSRLILNKEVVKNEHKSELSEGYFEIEEPSSDYELKLKEVEK